MYLQHFVKGISNVLQESVQNWMFLAIILRGKFAVEIKNRGTDWQVMSFKFT